MAKAWADLTELARRVRALDVYQVFEKGPIRRFFGAVFGSSSGGSAESYVRKAVAQVAEIEEALREVLGELESGLLLQEQTLQEQRRLLDQLELKQSRDALAQSIARLQADRDRVARTLETVRTSIEKTIPAWKRQISFLFRARQQQAASKYASDLPNAEPPARAELLSALERNLSNL